MSDVLKEAFEDYTPEANPEDKIILAPPKTIEETEERQTVVFQGPLAEAMTQALNIAFSKDDKVTGEPADNPNDGPALESQAQDAQLLKELSNSVVAEVEDNDSVTTVYGVQQNNVKIDDVVEIGTQLTEAFKNKLGNDRYAIVIDGTIFNESKSRVGGTGGFTEEILDLTPALESIAESYGIPIYRSLTEFARAHLSK